MNLIIIKNTLSLKAEVEKTDAVIRFCLSLVCVKKIGPNLGNG